MIEYNVISICADWEDTEKKLNKYAKDRWKLVCSYARGNWLIMERERRFRK